MTCPICGRANARGAPQCWHCSALLSQAEEDSAVRLARYARGFAFAGLFTCGIGAIIAIPIALWAAVEGRQRDVRPISTGTWVALVGMAVWSLWFVSGLMRARDAGLKRDAQSDCLDNLKQINLAAIMYAEDHGGHAPPPDRWIEALQPYTREPIFQCPSAPHRTVGYAFNPGAARRKWDSLPNAAKLVTFFDGKPGWDSVGDVTAVVPRHGPSQPYRAVIAFADGHLTSATSEEAERFVWRDERMPHAPSASSPTDPSGTK